MKFNSIFSGLSIAALIIHLFWAQLHDAPGTHALSQQDMLASVAPPLPLNDSGRESTDRFNIRPVDSIAQDTASNANPTLRKK